MAKQLDLPITTDQHVHSLIRRVDELSELVWRLSEKIERLEGEGPSILKRCARCRERKTLAEYSRNRSSKDGYHTYCEECEGERQRRYYLRRVGKAA